MHFSKPTTIRRRKKSLIYNCNKKNKIPGHKCNQGGKRPLHWKLRYWWNWQHKLNDVLFSWAWKINAVKKSIISKVTYRFDVIPVKILMACITETEKKSPQYLMELQKTPISQSNLEKEQSWRCHAFWFQTISQSYQNRMALA